MNDLRERLADLCHRQWAGWMEYLFSRTDGMDATNGEIIIKAEFVERWTRQMQTPYAALSEGEKDSDRKEADKFLEVVRDQHLRERQHALDLACHDCRQREQAALVRAVRAEQEIDRLQGLVRDCRRKDETGQACLERMLTNGRLVLIAETRERALKGQADQAEKALVGAKADAAAAWGTARESDKARIKAEEALAKARAELEAMRPKNETGYCPGDCGGCSCHIMPPCGHCTDHVPADG